MGLLRLVYVVSVCLFAYPLFAQLPPFEDLMRSDANNDSQVTVADASFINNYLFNGGSTPSCLDAADANDDGSIDVSDSSYITSYLFLGGPAPPSPFPYCGADPSSDSLNCQDSAC